MKLSRVCVCVCVRVQVCVEESDSEFVPLMEEIRYEMFGSPDLPDFRVDLLNDWDSVYSRENTFEILGTAEISCLIFTGTPVKTCLKFGQW